MSRISAAKANVNLALSAPELLESLKSIVCLIEQSNAIAITKNGQVAKARALISELEGR